MTAPGKPLDLDGMEAVARAATSEPWEAVLGEVPYEEFDGELTWTVDAEGGSICTLDGARKKPDAAHIATFDPPTVLALIQTQRELVGALEKARDQFRLYSKAHQAKATSDGDRKALVNHDMAAMCDAALAKALGEQPL